MTILLKVKYIENCTR